MHVNGSCSPWRAATRVTANTTKRARGYFAATVLKELRNNYGAQLSCLPCLWQLDSGESGQALKGIRHGHAKLTAKSRLRSSEK